MSTITASNIPASVSNAKLQDFFSFCGKIQSIDSKDSGAITRTVSITFESAAALQTALLLNGAELAGSKIEITESKGALPSDAAVSQPPAYASALQPPPQHPDTLSGTVTPKEDISQEEKPKTAILAQYLSHGYLLSDNLISKAIEHDQKNGYSSKFKGFLGSLDSKYHIQQKSAEADKKYNVTDQFQQHKQTLDLYFDSAKQTGIGSKIHGFYLNAAKDAKEVHEEAKRLAALKKQQQEASAGTSTDSAPSGSLPSFAEATGTTTDNDYPADNKIQ
ncbi:hypothetical protein BABINDRAFT_34788 [Babjeviella inositovora NRRL Y-12698]|uniref:RRM domain-containing protein n=1 Tax=Babjeviella inositovora NRRL Y-12698 TaxID=984486 RepID=A0A1E3QSZ8_9ASCO|nr:uncharacterized protein BABINDRAFT_34788 [Babjeviella inositovora NRRL Y-12698]ODQ80836.1 hypothetical protein BABINDRAFT_34788 [Babjeviella inositovora NRRL Y-12698]